MYQNQIYSKLSCHLPHMQKPDFIKIERQSCKIQSIGKQLFFKQTANVKPTQAMIILGILILNSQIYLIFVTNASVVFKQIKDDQIYVIQDVYHYSFRSSSQYKSSKNRKINQQILKYLQQTILKKNFYFRYMSDITLSLQNQKYFKKSSEQRFFFNKNMTSIFKENSSHKCWRIPIIQGYIKYESIGQNCYYLMINRRSKIHCGPKLLCRGIGQDGQNVANYNQTEEIVKWNKDCFSYVSIRGSVPVYWNQNKGYMEFKDHEKNPIAFHAHLKLIQKAHPEKKIYFFSWLGKDQIALKQKMDVCFYHSKHKYNESDSYKLFSVDIDENSKNAAVFLKQAIQKQMNSLMPYQDNFFWYVEQKGKQIVMAKQKLIYRVNCVDCTMKTNAILTQFSKRTMQTIENFVSIKKQDNQSYQQIQKIVTTSWKELGNRISRMYCGQQQIQIGKKQQTGFFAMFTLYKDPMNSEFKQKSLQSLLSEVTPKQVVWVQKNLQRKLNIREYCSIQKLRFFIFSWNCNNLNPISINELNKQKLLNFNRGKIDIVIFNLQQMVQLNTYNVLITIDQQVKTKWKQIILQILNQKIQSQQQKFDFIVQENLVAITTWIFIKNKIKVKHFQAKQKTIVKTGFANGLAGNKGAVIVFLKFDSTWIAIVNCHLTAGDGKKNQRKQTLQQILYSSLQDKFKDRMAECDVIFLIGDLNFRLQWSQQEVKSVLYEVQKKFNTQSLKMGLKTEKSNQQLAKILSILWQKDQLLNFKKNQDEFLNLFQQRPLVFMPTYKFLKKSHINEYDDKRSPAWCDRILFQQKIQGIANSLVYQDVDINLSDHKPVYSILQVSIKKINQKQNYLKRFKQLKSQYYKNKIDQIDLSKSKSKQNFETIDFFNEKKDINLIDLIDINVQVENQNNKKPVKTENLLQIDQQQKISQKSSSSPTKHDFSQFDEIAKNEIKKRTSQNLIDLE